MPNKKVDIKPKREYKKRVKKVLSVEPQESISVASKPVIVFKTSNHDIDERMQRIDYCKNRLRICKDERDIERYKKYLNKLQK